MKDIKKVEIKEHKVLDTILNTLWNLGTITLFVLFLLLCYVIIDKNTMIFKQKAREGQTCLKENIEVEIAKKEIDTNTDNDTGVTIATSYFYFYYDEKIKRCEVNPTVYQSKNVGDTIRIAVDIKYGTTGYTLSEDYKYLE